MLFTLRATMSVNDAETAACLLLSTAHRTPFKKIVIREIRPAFRRAGAQLGEAYCKDQSLTHLGRGCEARGHVQTETRRGAGVVSVSRPLSGTVCAGFLWLGFP